MAPEVDPADEAWEAWEREQLEAHRKQLDREYAKFLNQELERQRWEEEMRKDAFE